jgi:hypothetical protein
VEVLWFNGKANGETGSDYREKPINSQKDMLLDQNGNVIKVKVPQQHMLEYLEPLQHFEAHKIRSILLVKY